LAVGGCISAGQVPAYKNAIGVLVRILSIPFLYHLYYKKLAVADNLSFPSQLDFSCNRDGYSYYDSYCDWGWIIGYQYA